MRLWHSIVAVTDALTAVMIWSGATVGILKLIDWLLAARHKKRVTDVAETLWLWLSYQRSGAYMALLRRKRLQATMAALIYLFLFGTTFVAVAQRVFRIGGVGPFILTTDLKLGHPQLYESDLFVDAAALFVATVVGSLWLHPKIARWIGAATSVPRYFGRLALAFAVSWMALLPWAGVGRWLLNIYATAAKLEPSNPLALYERLLGGPRGVMALHGIVAVLSAAATPQFLVIYLIVLASLCWCAVVCVISAGVGAIRFVLLRIVENRDGPILALATALTALGAIAKAALGE